jgi:hypothetical protein
MAQRLLYLTFQKGNELMDYMVPIFEAWNPTYEVTLGLSTMDDITKIFVLSFTGLSNNLFSDANKVREIQNFIDEIKGTGGINDQYNMFSNYAFAL